MKPYIDDHGIRTFDSDIDPEQLVWHRDEQDRKVTILEGTNWQFQFDNQLPFTLYVGETINIPSMVYHRILKGENKLRINIE